MERGKYRAGKPRDRAIQSQGNMERGKYTDGETDRIIHRPGNGDRKIRTRG